MIVYEVKAYPLSAHDTRAEGGEEPFLVECSKCEVIGMYPETEVDEVCISHLESHGVDTTMYRKDKPSE